jgi:hypothetical protein
MEGNLGLTARLTHYMTAGTTKVDVLEQVKCPALYFCDSETNGPFSASLTSNDLHISSQGGRLRFRDI